MDDVDLGATIATYRARAWVQWLQLLLGLGTVAVGLWAIATGRPIVGGLPLDLVIPAAGIGMSWEAATRLRGAAVLTIAEGGLVDGFQRSAVVRWDDVGAIVVRDRTHKREGVGVVIREIDLLGPSVWGAETRVLHTIEAEALFGSTEPLLTTMREAHEAHGAGGRT
jgi:hypothetical protein